MYDKKKTRRKILAISCTALVMGGLLGAYDLHAAPIDRAVRSAVRALSPFRMLKERALRAEFEAGGPAAAPEDGSAWKGFPVLVYHGLAKKADRFSMTEKTFKDQMFAMKRAGYVTVTLKEFQAFARGEATLPPKSFLLTFDDGRSDSYEGADPILKTLGYTAVMFVASGASMPSEDVRWSYYISPNDIKDMLESGRWEIGSHAVQQAGGRVPISEDGAEANFLSSRRWLEKETRLEDRTEYAARVAYELQESKRVLEEAFVADVEAFSYPYGDYGQQSRNEPSAVSTIGWLVSEAYQFAFRQVWPNDGEFSFNYAEEEPFRLKRIETPTGWTGAQLVAYLESARDKPLPFRDGMSGNTGWQGTWGDVRLESGGLALAATATSTGAAAFLDGTRAWKDYGYAALFDRLGGSHVSLMARYRDSRNYTVCTLGGGRVKIERVVDGAVEKLADAELGAPFPETAVEAGMRVRGPVIECLLGSTPVASATGTDEGGGIGIRIWDEEPGTAALRLRRVDVKD